MGNAGVLLLPHSLSGLASLNLAKSPILSVQNALRPISLAASASRTYIGAQCYNCVNE